MLCYTSTLLSLALAISSGFAAPVSESCSTARKSGKGAPGGLFWMTNEAEGNFLMSANIEADGTLTAGKVTKVFGQGSHGVGFASINGQNPDPLFSQASVKVVGSAMVIVNPASNTLTMFSIDPANPSDSDMIGFPVSSGGEFPVSSTIDKQSGNVCVLNSGAINGVNCYKSDKKLGLMPIPNSLRSLNLNQTTPPSGLANTPSQILFSDDGKRLFASVKGSTESPGFLAVWDVNEDGSLSADFVKNTAPNGGGFPCSLTAIRGANALLNTDPSSGFSIFDFGGNDSNNGKKATATKSLKIDGQKTTCWSEFSDVTRQYYTTDIETDTLTEISIDAKTLEAQVTKQYPLLKGGASMDQEIASVGDKDFMYILSPNALAIQVLALKAPQDAQIIQTFDISRMARKYGVDISASNLSGMNAFFTPIPGA